MISTPRLLLREWRQSDLESLIDLNSDKVVMEHFPSVRSPEESRHDFQVVQEHFEQWGYGPYVVELTSQNQFIGFVGLFHTTFESFFTPCIEILWRLRKDMWGMGIASEAAQSVISHAFTTLNLFEIYSFTTIGNQGSKRVMEKIDMTYKGIFNHPNLAEDHPLCQHYLYHLSAEKWNDIQAKKVKGKQD